jgi:ribosome biogenesis GTPase A
MKKSYPGVIEERYGIESSDDIVYNIEEIAKVRGCLQKGGKYDIPKAAGQIIDDFRNGKLGRISLELPKKES